METQCLRLLLLTGSSIQEPLDTDVEDLLLEISKLTEHDTVNNNKQRFRIGNRGFCTVRPLKKVTQLLAGNLYATPYMSPIIFAFIVV